MAPALPGNASDGAPAGACGVGKIKTWNYGGVCVYLGWARMATRLLRARVAEIS